MDKKDKTWSQPANLDDNTAALFVIRPGLEDWRP